MTFHPAAENFDTIEQVSLAPSSLLFSNDLQLAPPRAFAEATASVEEALDELRAAEAALERHLSELRSYIRTETAAAARPLAVIAARLAA